MCVVCKCVFHGDGVSCVRMMSVSVMCVEYDVSCAYPVCVCVPVPACMFAECVNDRLVV